MVLSTATLPDGRSIQCVNAYEVDFSWHEVFSDDLTAHGLSLFRVTASTSTSELILGSSPCISMTSLPVRV